MCLFTARCHVMYYPMRLEFCILVVPFLPIFILMLLSRFKVGVFEFFLVHDVQLLLYSRLQESRTWQALTFP